MLCLNLLAFVSFSLCLSGGYGVAPEKTKQNGRYAKTMEPSVFETNKCAEKLGEGGKDAPWSLVGHAIHSLTVHQLRKFYPDADIRNFVPTINFNLSSNLAILPHAPDFQGPDVDKYLTGGMKTLDGVLTMMDEPMWNLKHYSTLEKVVHAFHMQEVWERSLKQFEMIKENPPTSDVCDCALDVEHNGIMKMLRVSAIAIRDPELYFGADFSKLKETQARQNGYSFQYPVYTHHFKMDQQEKGKKGNRLSDDLVLRKKEETMPRLTNAKAWKQWKKVGMTNQAEDFNNALFLYCAMLKARQQRGQKVEPDEENNNVKDNSPIGRSKKQWFGNVRSSHEIENSAESDKLTSADDGSPLFQGRFALYQLKVYDDHSSNQNHNSPRHPR